MRAYVLRSIAVSAMVVGLAGCLTGGSVQSEYGDLAKVETVEPGTEYRIGTSGICGTVEDDHIRVTRVFPGSPADGKIRRGDRVRGLQYRGLGGNIRRTVSKRIFRLGRDWDWHLYVTVEQPKLLGGRGNRVTFDLRVPRGRDGVYHFGPIGVFAKIQEDRLVVDKVVGGSPADGGLEVGDQVLAVNGQFLNGDVFRIFTACVDDAEAGKGPLALRVKRSDEDATTSRELEITVPLKELGEYAATAPLDCPKTDAIITRTADRLIETGHYGQLNIGLLALLSTGEKEYIEHVGKVLHGAAWAKPDVETSFSKGYVSWPYAYQTATLCEYYLLTGDEYVLPAIKAYASQIARGQDAAGLWNHRMANPDANFGQLHGRLYGYAAINQTSVALFASLILAQECGVKDPEVRAAVEKTHAHYSYWIGRGKLPYGNHGAGEDFFTNNGTSGSLAVAMALIGNKEGARFFSQMSSAATREILTGHTGPWFNILWSGLGANVSGPEMVKAYDCEMHWLRSVTRTWDGEFLEMQARGCGPGRDKLGSSGAYLLNLSAGRRAIRITGRGMDKSLWLDGKAAQGVVDAGTIDYSALETPTLLKLLGHALPPVRFRAAGMLAIRDASAEAEVMAMLTEGTRDQRVGALHAIASLKINAALGELMAIVRDVEDDLWIRQLALRKMTGLDGAAQHAPELLAMLAADKTYDVQGRFDEDLGTALVKLTGGDPYAAGLDKDLLYRAVNKLFDHKRQNARGAGMQLVKNIPLKDLHRVVDKMVYVIEDKDRTYVSYHGDGHRQTGLDILYGLNIDESLDLTVNTINEPVGRGWRARNRKAFMKTWGGEARRMIPKIKEVLGDGATEFVEQIEASTEAREMISLEEAKGAGEQR